MVRGIGKPIFNYEKKMRLDGCQSLAATKGNRNL